MSRFTDLFQETTPEPVVETTPEPVVETTPESVVLKNFKNMVYTRKKK